MGILDFSETDGAYQNFMKLKKIDGRKAEYIISRTGKLISMTAINMHDDIFDDLEQFQFQQDEIGKIVLKILPKKSLTLTQISLLESRLLPKFIDEFELKIEVVDIINLSKSGKFTFLIQNIKNHLKKSIKDS